MVFKKAEDGTSASLDELKIEYENIHLDFKKHKFSRNFDQLVLDIVFGERETYWTNECWSMCIEKQPGRNNLRRFSIWIFMTWILFCVILKRGQFCQRFSYG